MGVLREGGTGAREGGDGQERAREGRDMGQEWNSGKREGEGGWVIRERGEEEGQGDGREGVE